MVVMRELEPVPKESGTAATALRTQHPPNPNCPCHLTVPLYNLPGGCHCFRGVNTPGHGSGRPSERIMHCLAHRNELLVLRSRGDNGGGGGGMGRRAHFLQDVVSGILS